MDTKGSKSESLISAEEFYGNILDYLDEVKECLKAVEKAKKARIRKAAESDFSRHC